MNEGLLTKKEKRIEKKKYSKTFSNTKDGPISS